MAYVGVTDPASPHVESVPEVADLLIRAAGFIPAEQLGSTDDCGFSPFSADPRPLRGLPDLARGIAFRKIRSRVEGTYLAAEKIGIA
jgi:methionine synthase II (cobalamin-independent)